MKADYKDVWVLIEDSGRILTAWSSCFAGHCTTCNHVIGSLYKIEHANLMGYNDPACTDLPCAWNHTKSVPVVGCRFEDILVKDGDKEGRSYCTKFQIGFVMSPQDA